MAKCIPLHSLVITVIISAAIILNLLLNSIVNQLDSILIDKNGVNNKNLEAIIHHYQEEDVVTCLNQLSLLKKSRINDDTVQISFVGDSTIRNLFKSFIRVYHFSNENNEIIFYFSYKINHSYTIRCCVLFFDSWYPITIWKERAKRLFYRNILLSMTDTSAANCSIYVCLFTGVPWQMKGC